MRQAATLTKSVTSEIRYEANDQVKMADIGQGELEKNSLPTLLRPRLSNCKSSLDGDFAGINKKTVKDWLQKTLQCLLDPGNMTAASCRTSHVIQTKPQQAFYGSFAEGPWKAISELKVCRPTTQHTSLKQNT